MTRLLDAPRPATGGDSVARPPQFAIVPAGLLRCGRGLSPGAVKMAVWLLGAQGQRTRPCEGGADRYHHAADSAFWWTHPEAASALGVTTRCTRKWAAELRRAGILDGEHHILDPRGNLPGEDKIWDWWIPIDLTQAAELAPHLWRVWSVLASYTNKAGLAWPRVDTLAGEVGTKRSAVMEALKALKALGFIDRKHRRRGSTTTRVWTGGVNETGLGGERDRTSRRNETGHQGGTRPDTSTMSLVPTYESHVLSPSAAPGAAPPHQPPLLLSIIGGADGKQPEDARQGGQVEPPSEPEPRDAMKKRLDEAEDVLVGLGRSPLHTVLREITVRQITELKGRLGDKAEAGRMSG